MAPRPRKPALSKRAARERAARIARITVSAFVGVAALVVIVYLIVRGSSEPREVLENLAILLGVLVAIGTVVYISPGTQQMLKQRRKAWEDEQERLFWERREANDQKQAEAQERVAAERRRRQEEQERLAAEAKKRESTAPVQESLKGRTE